MAPRYTWPALLGLSLWAQGVGCGPDDPPAQPAPAPGRICTPGSYVFCRCADNQPGTRLCLQDGQSFDPCVCEGDPLGGGGEGGGGEGGGSADPADGCPGKLVILSPGDSTLISGSTAAATDDLTPTCGPPDGPDLVFRVQPQATGVMNVKVKGELPLDPVVYAARKSCDEPPIACANASSQGELEGFSLPVQAAEEIFIIVDSAGAGGTFAMTLSVQPTVANDACPGPSVPVSASSDAVLSGSTVYAKSDLVGAAACAVSGATGDVVYTVTPGDTGLLTATLKPESGFDAVLYARAGACADGPQIGCSAQGGAGAAEAITAQVKAGEPVFLFVDGDKGSVGSFSLSLHVDQASAAKCGNKAVEPGEQCDDGNDKADDGCSPGCLVEHNPPIADCPGLDLHLFDAPELISGSTGGYDDYDKASCGGDPGFDRFYAVYPHKGGTLRVKNLNASFDLVLFARGGSCVLGPELACANAPGNAGDELTVPVQQDKVVWVGVDGATAQSGTFTLSFQVE